MNSEEIQSFLSRKVTGKDQYVKINFQKRDPIYGLFLIEEKDFEELRRKNFWRIVTQKNFDQYKKSKDPGLSRIFNGSEMTRLSLLSEEF